MRGSAETAPRRPIFRLTLACGLLAYIAGVGILGATDWILRHPTPENIQRGTRWFPSHPTLWAVHGHQKLFQDDPDPAKAAEAFLRSASLLPTEATTWQGLSTAFSLLGDQGKSEVAIRNELVATPHAPQAAWRMANLLLLRQRPGEAVPYLRMAAASDTNLRTGVYVMASKIFETREVLQQVVPQSLEARTDYLLFLLDRERLPDAYEVWKLVRGNPGEAARAGQRLGERLIAVGRGVLAAQVWDDVLASRGTPGMKPQGDYLTNGDFEAEVTNTGLDWRISQGAGFDAAIDHEIRHSGAGALKVSFDGSVNVDFSAVGQLVPVAPGRAYRLEGHVKTEKITPRSAVHLCVMTYVAPRGEEFTRCSDGLVGTESWRPVQVAFESGQTTEAVWVGPRRMRSADLMDTKAQGTFWVDSLSLKEQAGGNTPK